MVIPTSFVDEERKMSSSNIYAGELLERLFSAKEMRLLELVLSDKTSEEIFQIVMEEEK